MSVLSTLIRAGYRPQCFLCFRICVTSLLAYRLHDAHSSHPRVNAQTAAPASHTSCSLHVRQANLQDAVHTATYVQLYFQECDTGPNADAAGRTEA
ncbi:hypothetical protein BDV19DRAFT_39049 [Aspergillus venezuelensis]